jgi:hypothetical protein
MEPCNEISPGLNSPYQDFVFLHNCDVNTKHVIQTMLDVEQNVYFKNVDYMKNVQKDGIKENWREKVAVWSFNVSLIFLVVFVSHTITFFFSLADFCSTRQRLLVSI